MDNEIDPRSRESSTPVHARGAIESSTQQNYWTRECTAKNKLVVQPSGPQKEVSTRSFGVVWGGLWIAMSSIAVWGCSNIETQNTLPMDGVTIRVYSGTPDRLILGRRLTYHRQQIRGQRWKFFLSLLSTSKQLTISERVYIYNTEGVIIYIFIVNR